MADKTCGKCQSIPRYRLKQEGGSTTWFSCWPHLQRTVDELLADTKTGVLIRRHP